MWVKQPRGINVSHYLALYGRKPAFVEAFFQVDYKYFGDTAKRRLAPVDILNPVESVYVDPDEGLP